MAITEDDIKELSPEMQEILRRNGLVEKKKKSPVEKTAGDKIILPNLGKKAEKGFLQINDITGVLEQFDIQFSSGNLIKTSTKNSNVLSNMSGRINNDRSDSNNKENHFKTTDELYFGDEYVSAQNSKKISSKTSKQLPQKPLLKQPKSEKQTYMGTNYFTTTDELYFGDEYVSAQNSKKISPKTSKQLPQKPLLKQPKSEKQIYMGTNGKIRFTAPRKRGLLARYGLQHRYLTGDLEDVAHYYEGELEDEYSEIPENSPFDYREIQAYEDARDDKKMRRGILAVKTAAVVLLLSAILALAPKTKQDANANAKVTIETATEGQTAKAEQIFEKILETQEKEFDYSALTHDEILDAILRLSPRINNEPLAFFRQAFFDFSKPADQILLETIVDDVYEEEYYELSYEKKRALKQLTYELLEPEKQNYIRNPINYDRAMNYKNEQKANSENQELEME